LCVNVGKRVERTASMRSQSKDGAIWVPAQLLDIVPYQTVKSQLPPALIASMITAALRKPALNARLIVEEGLDLLRIPGRSTRSLVSLHQIYYFLTDKCVSNDQVSTSGRI
jgi:hypothetical protein